MIPLEMFVTFLISVLLPSSIGYDVCSNSVVDIPSYGEAEVSSEGYDKGLHYPTDKQCQFTFTTTKGMRLRIQFDDLDLEASDSCLNDYVQLLDGWDSTFGFFCGSRVPRPYLTSGNVLTVVFVSDFMITGRGFRITCRSTSSSSLCTDTEFLCRNRKCVSDKLTCDGRDDCEDGTDEENCGHPVRIPRSCGTPVIQPIQSGGDRVVGGQEVRLGSWPWQADIQTTEYDPNGHVCGGALITSQWVLTATHCFENPADRSRWTVRFGNHHKFQDDPLEQQRFIEKYIVYPDITDDKFKENPVVDLTRDITLVKLNAPVRFTNHVLPACLPSQNERLPEGTVCYAIGWGETRGSGGNDVLKQMSSILYREKECYTPLWQFNDTTMVCSGNKVGGDGVCHGDSGGPLMCQRGGRWFVQGVASYVTDYNYFGGLCGMKNRPSVFTRVSYYTNWINTVVKNFS